MNTEKFNEIVDNRIEKIKAVLMKKAKEYGSADDRLYNFKRAAEIERSTQRKAWLGHYTKHAVSVLDMVEGRIKPTKEMVDEKIGDAINYHILLEGILEEEMNENTK